MQPLFESFPGPFLKSGMGLLARNGNHQEIISRKLEQMYALSDTKLEWPGEGSLFESDSNKRRGPKTGPLFESSTRPLLKSGLQPLGRYGTHQEIISRRLNRCIFHMTQDWSGLGRGHYSSRTQINARDQYGTTTPHLPFKINLSFNN